MRKTTYLILLALVSLSAITCSGKPENQKGEVKIEKVNRVDSIPLVGQKIEGYYDQEHQYWVVEEGTEYETYPMGHLPQYTAIHKVDSERNILGSGFLKSETGEVLIPPKYFGMDMQFSNGLLSVSDRNHKWGLVNQKGEEIVAPQYDYIGLQELTDGLIKVSTGDKQGYINTKGVIVIPIEYNTLGIPSEGMISFANEPQRWGYINYKNEVIIQPEFTFETPFQNGKVVLQKEGGQDYIIYKDGRIEKVN